MGSKEPAKAHTSGANCVSISPAPGETRASRYICDLPYVLGVGFAVNTIRTHSRKPIPALIVSSAFDLEIGFPVDVVEAVKVLDGIKFRWRSALRLCTPCKLDKLAITTTALFPRPKKVVIA
uniref:Uncharacterized protein n=1 Tax=Rhodosorus marinus TaxID=101924 RepID=A0A7S0BDB3_9RHOD|mmetsp:Transcript_10444/g.15140  ORF Transcript_10444/g.15140 Transcript_10444/m.15140 type:complete len:122 (+) Transcript_10444:509-874(+)